VEVGMKVSRVVDVISDFLSFPLSFLKQPLFVVGHLSVRGIYLETRIPGIAIRRTELGGLLDRWQNAAFTASRESSTSVEIAWTFLDTILRLIFFSLLKSAIYDDPLAHRFGRSVALT
jgi:hypothetical protein